MLRFLVVTMVLVALCSAQPPEQKRPWKGYAILGNGHVTAVYSDDIDGLRISPTSEGSSIFTSRTTPRIMSLRLRSSRWVWRALPKSG